MLNVALSNSSHGLPAPLWRGARLVALALIIGIGINHLYWALSDWNLVDMNVYWDAALRLRAGDPLYDGTANTFHAYRYAPWFAYAWVPLTYLPKALVGLGWSTILLVATAALLWPLVRIRSTAALLLIALMLPLLIPMVTGGNVQPLMVAMLLFGLPRRSGPVWIALAASLKVTPILFVLVYLGRREWLKALLAAGLTVVLLAPALLLGFSAVTIDAGPVAALPAISPLLYVMVGLATMPVAWWINVRNPAFGPLAAAVATIVTLPRLFLSDVTVLLASLPTARRIDSPEDVG